MECEECGYSCESEEKLERHLQIHAIGLRCVSCQYSAPTRAKWRDHVNSPSHVAAHKCRASPDCGFVAETSKTLDVHLKVAHKETPHIGSQRGLKCSRCDFAAVNHMQMKKHLLTHKKDEIIDISTKKFRCSICNWSAETERKLKNHLWRHSGDEQKEPKAMLSCDHKDCKFKALTPSKLEKHKLRHLPNPPKYECDFCPKSFNTTDSLRGHRRLHTDRAIFVCPIAEEGCRFTTSLPEYMRAHVRMKHPNHQFIKCAICDFVARDAAKLEEHVKLTHPTEGLLKCDKCGYETDRRKRFENHFRKHATAGAKVSRCVICKESFAGEDELEAHMAVHKEKFKPYRCTKRGFTAYSCPKCDYGTQTYRYFKEHLERHLIDESDEVSGDIDIKEDANFRKRTKTLNNDDIGTQESSSEKSDGSTPNVLSSSSSSSFSISSISIASSSRSAPSTRLGFQGSRPLEKFDFEKNVAGFLWKNSRKQTSSSPSPSSSSSSSSANVKMMPVVVKEEPEDEQHFRGYDLKPKLDCKPELNEVYRNMDVEVGEEEEEETDEEEEEAVQTDVKPDLTAIKVRKRSS